MEEGGQLNIVEKLLKEKKINSIDVIGIAKGKKGMFDLIKFMTKTVL